MWTKWQASHWCWRWESPAWQWTWWAGPWRWSAAPACDCAAFEHHRGTAATGAGPDAARRCDWLPASPGWTPAGSGWSGTPGSGHGSGRLTATAGVGPDRSGWWSHSAVTAVHAEGPENHQRPIVLLHSTLGGDLTLHWPQFMLKGWKRSVTNRASLFHSGWGSHSTMMELSPKSLKITTNQSCFSIPLRVVVTHYHDSNSHWRAWKSPVTSHASPFYSGSYSTMTAVLTKRPENHQ